MTPNEAFQVEIKSGRGTLISPHFHEDHFEIIEVVKGSLAVTVGLSVTHVPTGGILHLLPGFVQYAVSAGEEECLVHVLTYRPDAVLTSDSLDEQFLSFYMLPIGNRAVLFPPEHPLHAALAGHMETAISEWRGREILYRSLVLAELSHMLVLILRSYGYREEGQEYQNMMRIAPAIRYILSGYSDRLRLEDLAAKLYLSPDHFGKLFRATVGLTPIEYINHVRINAALRLLAEGNGRIAEVSRAAGFTNTNYFHKVFHDLLGIGPAALRKQWRTMSTE